MSKVKINVGGTVFETTCETLLSKPDTKLGSLESVKEHKKKASAETLTLFYDRNPEIFNFILDIYRNGQLHLPTHVCGATIRNEMDFWEIPLDLIGRCCLQNYYKYDHDMEVLGQIERSFYTLPDCNGKQSLRTSLLRILEDPKSSWAALIFSFVFMMMVVLTTVTMFLATCSDMRVLVTSYRESDNKSTAVDGMPMMDHSVPSDAIFYIDSFCLVFFSIECMLTLILYESKARFFSSKLNLADMIAIFAGWINFALYFSAEYWLDMHGIYVMTRILTMARILRLLRFYKLFRQYPSFRVILLTIYSSFKQLCMTLVFAVLAIIFFAMVTFYAELEGTVEKGTFSNAFEGLWWALVTMTTLGYGDFVPKTTGGRIVGSVAVVCGALILAMPIAIVTSNFNSYHDKNKDLSNHFAMRNCRRKSFRKSIKIVQVRPEKIINS